MNTAETVHTLNQYAQSSGTWISVPTTYVKIGATNIGVQLKEYDGVTISGFTNASLNGDFILYGAGADYIIIAGILDEIVEQTGGVTVERTVPDMDFLTEAGNRVWGCSSAKHEIYSCRLGDPFNWHCFMGLSTDSYAATVGTDGDFTGACNYLGNPLFFKEEAIHKIYGNKPANFQISDSHVRGVEKGSEKSLVSVNETLYYKARNAICAYTGALPASVSQPLGDVRYKNAAAGALGDKYYLSMQDPDGDYHMFVYDQSCGLWHREDHTHASYFALHEGELFYIDADTKKIMTVNGRLSVHEGGVIYDLVNGAVEEDFEWYVESGDIGMSLPDNKYVSRLMIRLDVQTENPVFVSFLYDNEEEWKVNEIEVSQYKRTITVPVIPQRCDHLRIKIEGTGPCKIYSITKTIEEGAS
ncbi:MAG: hypothetical protein ACYCX2_11995 [Christensenellales bacterium]